jgi:hypothetical protein
MAANQRCDSKEAERSGRVRKAGNLQEMHKLAPKSEEGFWFQCTKVPVG